MKFYIFKEIDENTGQTYWAAYRQNDGTGYITVSLDGADHCERKAMAILNGKTEPVLVRECES